MGAPTHFYHIKIITGTKNRCWTSINLSGEKVINLIKFPTVKSATKLSKSSLYVLMKQNCFHKSIQIGKSSVAWIESEVQQWIEDQIYQSRNA